MFITDSEIGKLNSLEQAFLIQDLRTLVYDFTKGEDSDVLLAPISRLLSTEGDSSDFLLSLRYKIVNASAIHHMTSDILLSLRYKVVNASAIHHMTLARIRSALGITTVVSPAAGMWRFTCDDPHGEQAAAAFVAAKVTSGMLTENPDDLYDDEVIDALDGHDLSGNPALQKAQRQCSSSSPEAWLYSSAALSIEGTDVRTKLIDITRASLLQSLLDETEMHDEELQPWVDIACDWLLLGLCEFTMGQALSSVEPVDWFQAVLYLFGTVGIKLSDHEECCEHSIECTGFTLNQFRSSALVYLFATVWHCFNEKQCHTVLQLMEGHLDGAGNWRPCVDNDHDGSDEGSEGMRIAS